MRFKMKRLCLILAYLFLFSQTASAMPLLVGQKVVYRGTITGLRISAVDGTAFIDNAGATIPTYADGNHSIEIYDSSNRMLKGVLKAAGTSEGLGSELITGWTNSSGNPFETLTVNANGRDIDSAINSSGTGRASIGNQTAYALFKGLFNVTYNSGSGMKWCVGNVPTAFSPSQTNYTLVSGAQTTYISTYSSYALGIYSMSNMNVAMTASVKQVTAPSSSGATIVSAKGGTTYNFSYKNDSFTYNAASYYVIIRAIR